MDDLKTKIKEDLDGLKPGSEEYLNQAKSYAEVTKAEAEERKAASDEKFKMIEKWTIIAGAVGTVLMGIGKLLEPILRRISNKDWVEAEDKGFYVKEKDKR